MVISRYSNSFYCKHILLPLFISCVAYNAVRRTLGEAAPTLIENGFFERSNYATINTVAFILYGLSKFFTSHIVRGNLFYLYSCLCIIVFVLTFLCGITCQGTYSSYVSFFIFWSLNYIVMGSLWPIICIIFKKWVPDDCIFFPFFSCSARVVLVGHLLLQFHWDYSMQHDGAEPFECPKEYLHLCQFSCSCIFGSSLFPLSCK